MSFCDSVGMTVSLLLWGSGDDSYPDKDLSTCSSALEGVQAVIDPRRREWRLQSFHSLLPLMCENADTLFFISCVCLRSWTYLYPMICTCSVLLSPPCCPSLLPTVCASSHPDHLTHPQLPCRSTEPIQADRVGSLLRLQWSLWFRWWPGYAWHEGKWDLTVRAVDSEGSAE